MLARTCGKDMYKCKLVQPMWKSTCSPQELVSQSTSRCSYTTLGHISKRSYHKDRCSTVFIVALFIKAIDYCIWEKLCWLIIDVWRVLYWESGLRYKRELSYYEWETREKARKQSLSVDFCLQPLTWFSILSSENYEVRLPHSLSELLLVREFNQGNINARLRDGQGTLVSSWTGFLFPQQALWYCEDE